MISLLGKWSGKQNSPRHSREHAEQLFEAGQIRDAIALLTKLNRQAPDAEIEQRLVQMRHHGFFRLAHPAGRETWPPACFSSPYPAGEIPAISGVDLTARILLDGIMGHGALFVRDLVPKADCDLMIRAVDNAIMAYDARPDGDACWFSPLQPCAENGEQKVARGWVRNGGGALAADCPRGLFHLLELLEHLGVPDTLAQYLGEWPALSVKKTTLRRVSADTNSGWHQDGAFLGKGVRTLNLWIALTDCGVDAPSMDMVPTRLSSIIPSGAGQADFGWSLDDQAVLQAAGNTPPVRLQFKAGDAIFFDEMNLHRTAVDPSMTGTRYAIEAWFFAPSHYPLNQLPVLV